MASPLYRFNIGDSIHCQWKGELYKAKVMKRRTKTEYYVHYSGWDQAWDEWVQEDSCLDKTAIKRSKMRLSDSDQSTNGNEPSKEQPILRRERKEWTEEEIQYLIKNRSKYTTKELAIRLQRTEGTVTQKLSNLEFEEKNKKRHTFSVFQREFETDKSLNTHVSQKHAKLRTDREIKNSKDRTTQNQDSSEHGTSNNNPAAKAAVNAGNSTINIHMTVPSKAVTPSTTATVSKSRKRVRFKNEEEDIDQDDRPKKKRKVDKLKWSKYEMAEWVESLDAKFKKYAHLLIEEDVTGELMDTLDDDSLADIIAEKLHRIRILLKWKKL